MTRKSARNYCLSASVLSGIVLALLAGAMVAGDIVPADAALRDIFRESQEPWLTNAFLGLTHLGSVEIVIVIACLAFAGFRAAGLRCDARALAWTMAAGMLVENAMKFGFHRARPQPWLDVPLPGSYSFPSGHALFATCLYGAIAWGVSGAVRGALARWLVWAAALFLIASIGISRIYLGVHYPSDVAAGWLAGILCVAGVRLAQGHHAGRHIRLSNPDPLTEPADEHIHRIA